MTPEEEAEIEEMAEALVADEEFTVISEDMGEEEEFTVTLTEDDEGDE